MKSDQWWRDAVVYQIYPRSFADGNGDGVGDLAGIIERVPYIAGLGVDAIWLSPIFTSPMADFGYDVADYCDVDPVFGRLADLDRLVAACHDHGLRVTLDWVPNHTSDRHPWFVESRSSRDHPKRDWYVWRDPAVDGGPPNAWRATFGDMPAWTFDEATGQYYLHLFLPEQPDLNWFHPDVEAAMHDTLRFWLDRGIDGFRADVVHLIGKDPALRDLRDDQRGPVIIHIDEPATHDILRRIRSLLDSYDHDPMMVGEVTLLGPGQAASYLGSAEQPELHLVFDFRAAWSSWDAAPLRAAITGTQAETPPGLQPTWVLSNHDIVRHRTRFGTEARARAAAVMSLTQRATVYLYAGEELGLPDATIPDDRVVDPGGRDGCRAPIPWTAEPGHGWGSVEPGSGPWLPFVDDAGAFSAASQNDDDASMLALYRRLIALRRETSALRNGTQTMLDVGDDVLAWERSTDADSYVVAVNLSEKPVIADFGDRHLELVATSRTGREGTFDGALLPDEAVILHDRSR